MLEGCLCPLLTVVSNLTDKRGHFPAILSWVVGDHYTCIVKLGSVILVSVFQLWRQKG